MYSMKMNYSAVTLPITSITNTEMSHFYLCLLYHIHLGPIVKRRASDFDASVFKNFRNQNYNSSRQDFKKDFQAYKCLVYTEDRLYKLQYKKNNHSL